MTIKTKIIFYLCLITYLAPLGAFSAPVEIFSPQTIGNIMMNTVIILILIVLTVFCLKRFYGQKNAKATDYFETICSYPLDSKTKLMLVKIGNKQHLLLGITPQQVTKLHCFAEGEDINQLQNHGTKPPLQ